MKIAALFEPPSLGRLKNFNFENRGKVRIYEKLQQIIINQQLIFLFILLTSLPPFRYACCCFDNGNFCQKYLKVATFYVSFFCTSDLVF